MTTCAHCGRDIADDDGTWYHPDTMTARCDGPDDELGLYWSDMVRQAEPTDAWDRVETSERGPRDRDNTYRGKMTR